MKQNFYLLFVPFALLLACNDIPEDNSIIKNKLIGTVQKGPFINGTSIVVSESDENYSLTGKTFDIQILDNSGHFELKNAELKSTVVQLKASGYYFNEVTGKQSVAPINLFALADINSKDSVCINVLTHLEKSRIEYLINTGLSFGDA